MSRPSLRLALPVLCGGLASPAVAQQYINATTPQAFQDIGAIAGCTPTARSFSSADDGEVSGVPIGFGFTFFGQTFTTVNFGSNGYMTFEGSASSLGNVALGGTAAPNNFIAPFWDDLLHPQAANAASCTFGTAPNRVFVIQGGPVARYGGSGDMRYQIRLYEGAAGRFEWSVAGSLQSSSTSATVGYEGPGGVPSFSPVACGATGTCSDTDQASLVGFVYAAFIARAPELTGGFGPGWTRGAFPGQSASGPVVVRNLAVDTATTVVTELYLSSNATLEPSDALIGTVTHGPVPGGNQPRTQTATVTIPPGTPPGDYYFIAKVDAPNAYPEAVETDNAVASSFRFATAYDLVPTAASSANGGNPGDAISVSVTIANAGVPYSGPVEVAVYASLDQIFDVNDPQIASTTVSHAGGASESFTVNGTLPQLAPGAYFPIVTVDGSLQIVELSETNNSFTSAQSFPTGPDFTISSVSVPAQAAPNTSFEVTTTVGSVAVPYSGQVGYRLFLSENASYEPTDLALGAFSVTFAGERSLVSREQVTMPVAAAPGSYYVLATADAALAIRELNETNNTAASGTTVLNGYDFRVANVTVTANAEPGQPVTVTAQLQSVGLGFTGALPYTVYASPDAVFDPADIPIYNGSVFLAGLSSTPLNQTFNLPRTTPIGTYRAIVVADPANLVPETNDTNNSAASGSTLSLRGADLLVRDVSGPDFGFGGLDYPLTFTIANEGEAPARGFSWAVYYSENDIIRVTDRQVLVSTTATLAVGATMTVTATVPLPVETATATRYLGVFADIYSRVPELRETNNVRALPHGVRVLFPVPDLAGAFVETATLAAAGEPLAITRILRNEGVADAASFVYAYVLSTNPTISTDDVELGRFTSAIPMGGDDYGIDLVSLPASLVPGTYYLGLVLDPDAVLDQVTRDNDVIVGPSIAVFASTIRFVTDRLPNGTIGVPYEAGIYANGGAVTRSWSLSAGRLPGGLSLDASSGIISGTPTEEGNFELTVRASAGTAYADRAFSLRITAPTVALAVATALLPPGLAGRSYDASLVAVGGTVPYAWTVISSLPPGLTLEPSGRVRGVPTAPGNFRVVVRVRDDLGTSVSKEVGLNVINPAASVLIQQQSLRVASVGVEYCDPDPVAFAAMGGIPPYAWRLEEGGVPGLTLGADGALCGVPERAGSFPILVRVQDQTGLFDTSLFIVEVDSGTELAVATGELPRATVGVAYTAALTAVRGELPYEWAKIQGELPPGITMSAAGELSGTPTAAGTFAFTIQLKDAKLRTDLRPLSIIVAEPESAGGDDDEDSGCGCAAAGRSSIGEAWLFVLALGLARWRPRRRALALAALLALPLAVAPGAAEAQTPVPGTPYVIARRPLAYAPLTTSTQIFGGSSFADSTTIPIPFAFRYYNTDFTQVTVGSHGVLVFAASPPSFITTSNSAPGTSSTPNGVLAPFWDDLETASDGAVVYAIEGTAPRRVLTIEWRNIISFFGSGPRANFQVRLFEGVAGRIQVRYGAVGTGASLSGTMGMEDDRGGRAVLFDSAATPCTSSCNNARLTAMSGTEVELVQDPGIELVALDVQAPSFGYLGAPMQVPVTIANLNGSTIGPFSYAIEASRSRNMQGAVRIHASSGVTFPPYATSTQLAEVTPPVSLGEGEYYLSLVVDSAQSIAEVDETNNRAVSAGRVRILQGRPDLVVERVSSASQDAQAGGALTVYARVANRGSDPATARASVMLSSNPAISSQDLALGSFNVTLAPGQTTTATQTVTLPADTNSGAYSVGVFVDVDGTVEELSESNNGLAAYQPIRVSGAGLAITTARLPGPVIGVPYLAILSATGGAGGYRWEVTSGALPAGIGLVPNTGELFGRASRAESQTLTFRVSSGGDSASRELTITSGSPDAPLTIVSRALPVGTIGQEYAFELVATGGAMTSSPTWSAMNLPAGLSLAASGLLGGVPTAVGSATVTVSLSDGAASATRELLLTVRDSNALSIEPTPLPNAMLGASYEATLSAKGGTPPLTWTIELGVLPTGITLEPLTGRLVGTPTQVGRFRVVLRARDAGQPPLVDTNTFELFVLDAGGFSISTATLPTAHVGEAFDVTVESMGGTAPYSWSIAEGRLPPGISSELRPETGAFRIVGTPTEVTVSNLLVQVVDGAGRTAMRAFAIDVQPKIVVTTPDNRTEDGGCGCSTGRPDASLLALALFAGLGVAKRRRAGPIHGRP